MKNVMPYVDVIIGNEEDFEKMLGIKAEGHGRELFEDRPGELQGCCREGHKGVSERYSRGHDASRSEDRFTERLAHGHDVQGRILCIAQVREPGDNGQDGRRRQLRVVDDVGHARRQRPAVYRGFLRRIFRAVPYVPRRLELGVQGRSRERYARRERKGKEINRFNVKIQQIMNEGRK